MSVAKAQKHSKGGRGGGTAKKKLGFSQRDSSPWELPDDAALRIGQVVLAWAASGGYIAVFETSDGGALGLLFKHDDYQDEKVYMHDGDDLAEFEDEFWKGFNDG